MNTQKNKWGLERYYTIVLWGIVIWFTALYATLIFSHNIWTDEAFTLQLLRGNVQGILEGTANDVHPPLYYLYAKIFWELFRGSLVAQKIATILPMTVLLIVGATLIRKEFGSRIALLFLLFITCIPCTMEFSVQVRMYSMALLFVTLCGFYAYRAYESGKRQDFLIYGVSGVLAAYTHYFAFVSVGVIAGFLLIAVLLWNRKRLAAWGISAVSMVVLYLPWMPSFVRQVTSVEQGYWIPEITAQTVWDYFVWTFDLELIPGMVFVFLLILKATSLYNVISIEKYREQTDIYALVCMLVPTFTALFGVVASALRTPIYRDQYILPALGMLALFFGLALRKAKKQLVIAVSLFLLFVGAVQYKECFRQEYRSSYVEQTESFFENNLEDGDYVIYNWKVYGFIYECYFDKDRLYYWEDFDFSQDFHNVWLLRTQWEAEIPQELLDANGLVAEDMGIYGIEQNEFSIVKIHR